MTTPLPPFRAVSTLILKSVDDEARVIEGVASSAKTDAAGDILEPRGAVLRVAHAASDAA